MTDHLTNILHITLTDNLRSFVGGASNDEVDRDLAIARQPYNGNNTPNLVYSDYESRSTTHSERAISPARTEIASSSSATSEQYNHPASSSTNYTTNTNNNINNVIYPPYEFEEIPQERSRDWWPYRSTTTA